MPDALTPAQLDRIEDALERLELDGVDSVMADGESDADVEATLSAYRSILELSREAMPPVDVPAGLLDDVLREARTAAAVPSSATTRSVPWYRRVRWNLWGPGLAFAGSAALLLVLVRPAADEASSEGAVAQGPTPPAEEDMDADAAGRADRSSDARLADATLPQRSEAGEPARGAGVLGEEQAADGLAEAADEDAEEEIAADPSASSTVDAKPRARKGVSGTRSERDDEKLPSGGLGAGGSVPGGSSMPSTAPELKKSKSGGAKAPPPAPKKEPAPTAPAPAQKPADNSKDVSDAWSSVLAGDAKRRAGNCTGARASYNAAVDGDAKTRARALAGLGLCALAKGDEKTAAAYFSKARKADGSVGSFIEAERRAYEAPEQAEPPNADVAFEQADEE
jgi:hypothetical protein